MAGLCLQVLYRQCCVSATPCSFVLGTISKELAALTCRFGGGGIVLFSNTSLEVFLLGVLCYVRKVMPCVALPPFVSDVVSAAELFAKLLSKLEFREHGSATQFLFIRFVS